MTRGEYTMLFWVPLVPATPNSLLSNAGYGGPLSDSLANAIYGNEDTATPVPTLLAASSPAAVLFGIPKVVVYPLKRVLFAWCSSHIAEKDGHVFPRWANTDTSGAVVRVLGVLFLIASCQHVYPGGVLLGPAKPVLKVCCVFSALPPEAAARCSLALYQVTARNTYRGVARAPAQPGVLTIHSLGLPEYNKTAVRVARDIFPRPAVLPHEVLTQRHLPLHNSIHDVHSTGNNLVGI